MRQDEFNRLILTKKNPSDTKKVFRGQGCLPHSLLRQKNKEKKLYGCDGKGRASGSISPHKDRGSNVCLYMCVRECIYESS